jgi:hypothetical protein
MFSDLINNNQPLKVDDSELSQPISFDADGRVATLGNLIDYAANPEIKSAFHRARAGQSSLPRPVQSVMHLDNDARKLLTIEVLNRADQNEVLSVVGDRDYRPADLIHEVQNNSDLGQRMVAAVIRHSLFLENAVIQGQIMPASSNQVDRFPDFDF